MWNCTHFKHPTDEQLRLLDISSNNNLPSVLFEFVKIYVINSLPITSFVCRLSIYTVLFLCHHCSVFFYVYFSGCNKLLVICSAFCPGQILAIIFFTLLYPLWV